MAWHEHGEVGHDHEYEVDHAHPIVRYVEGRPVVGFGQVPADEIPTWRGPLTLGVKGMGKGGS